MTEDNIFTRLSSGVALTILPMRTEAQSEVSDAMRYNLDEYQRGDQQISVRDEACQHSKVQLFDR